MSRISDIFLRVRDILGDSSGDRWSDTVLLRLFNDAQKDIAIHTEVLRDIVAIPLEAGRHTYTLPIELIRIIRTIYDGSKLPLVSVNQMDSQGISNALSTVIAASHSNVIRPDFTDWLVHTTDKTLEAAVFDKLNRQKLRVYPRPIGSDLTQSYDFDSVYGIVIGITDEDADYIFDTYYGIAVSITDSDSEIDSFDTVYGVIASIEDVYSLIVYYTKTPNTVTSVDDIPELDPCWDSAIKYYIAGHAFRNDIKEENRKIGAENLALYGRELGIIEEITNSDSVSEEFHQSTYNGMG